MPFLQFLFVLRALILRFLFYLICNGNLLNNPGQLGADQVADAVAGIAGYPVPLILIDMGTATTASVVNSKKQYVGGMILPGVGVSLDALTAPLPIDFISAFYSNPLK